MIGRSGNSAGPAGTLAVLMGAQFAAGVGFYAVTAHLVAHLHHDLGLLALGASVVIAVRVVVQYVLYLPAGVLADRLGPARAAALGCLVRAAGLAALAPAAQLPALVGAAVLVGIGGCFYTPAGSSILAGLPADWSRRGFAWYTAVGQLAAVVGPLVGLGLVTGPNGFAGVAWLAGACWAIAAMLLAPLHSVATRGDRAPVTPARRAVRDIHRAVRDIRDDRALLRFALACSPATLLVTQAAVVVPLAVPGSWSTTLFLTCGATCTALAQLPLWRPALARHGLPLGFGLFAVAYALLFPIGNMVPTGSVIPAGNVIPSGNVIATASMGPLGNIIPVAGTAAGDARFALVGLAGTLYGVAQGALLPALFLHTRRLAPPGRTGAYFGAVSFVAGLVALLGAAATGLMLDHGRLGSASALAVLCACAGIAAGLAGAVGPPDGGPGRRDNSGRPVPAIDLRSPS